MRTRRAFRAAIKFAVAAAASVGLAKLIAYDRANRAPDPSTRPYPPPPHPPGLRPDGTEDPDFGIGVFGPDGEPLTNEHGNLVLLRPADLAQSPPTGPPWEIELPADPEGTVRRVKRRWFGGAQEIVSVPQSALQKRTYRLDDGKVYCVEDPDAPGLTPLRYQPPVDFQASS
jgi:hypothetical protein